MSGGVDSSVAALLLRDAGCRVFGVFMKNWDEDDADGCTAAADLEDARRVCDALELPLHKVSFADEYWERVFAGFLRDYEAGRTPNPDVLCNSEIKFSAFLDYARGLGADFIATGHYARLQADGELTRLLRAADPDKDQTYFLHAVGQTQLRRALFPLGELTKPEVRALAAEAGLHNHQRRDSTGICFIGERRFADFLARFVAVRPGPIVTETGREVGRHKGVALYTLGQRHGLGVGGRSGEGHAAWYVIGKDVAGNRLIVGQGHDHPRLLRRHVAAEEPRWVRGSPPATPLRCSAQVRYRQRPEPCTVTLQGARIQAEFDRPQRAVAPGQFLVLYEGEECIGGGEILD
jgi:tRNA-specific 2-thiouridylase